MKKKALVIGSGRWGTSMAIYLSDIGLEVDLLCRDRKKADFIKKNGYSPQLPDFPVSSAIKILSGYASLTQSYPLIFISTPLRFLKKTLEDLGKVDPSSVLIGINKGMDAETLMTPPQVIQTVFPENPVAQLSGPCFPAGLIYPNFPAAETLACKDKELGLKLVSMLSSAGFRLYYNRDLEGVAFLGALKNVYAIAAGIIEGLNLNEEAPAILVTRSLAELKKLCFLLSIEETTLYGLSGLGDTILTCYSKKSSQNKTFGLYLVETGSAEEAVRKMENKCAEGYYTIAAVKKTAEKYGLEMPIIETVYGVVYEGHNPAEAIKKLMNRPLKTED